MTTMSNVLTAAEGGAAGGDSSDFLKSERDGGQNAQPVAAPSFISATTVRDSLTESWVWADSPPALRDVVAGRMPRQVPGDSDPVRVGWLVWNLAVAIPTTAVFYALAWMLQHPARAVCLALVAGPVGFFWITG